MTGMLASVANLEEAILVRNAGADIIDLKAPSEGALGALDIDSVENIVHRLNSDTVISATVGDLPMQPDIVGPAVARMWATGVDYVKIGLFPGGEWNASIATLATHTIRGARLIAVFFADCDPETTWFPSLSRAGFAGVMLDTKDKTEGSLRQILERKALAQFVSGARDHELLCGLAGSLRIDDIDPLLELNPDYLGFRGALCRHRNRVAQLDPEALRAIRGKFADRQKIGDRTGVASFGSEVLDTALTNN